MLESTGKASTGEPEEDAIAKNSRTAGRKGIFISRRLIASHLLIVSIALITVALTVYYFGIKCQNYDDVALILDVPTEIPTPTDKTTAKSIRLPRNVHPVHYDIRLLPWMEEGNFTTNGFVRIMLECVETTDKIVLHSTDIEIDRTSVQIVNAAEDLHNVIEIDRFEEDTERQFFIVYLKSFDLLPGYRYNLSMDFTGSLNDQQRGFYRDFYIENGEKKYIAMSQMEPVDARRAFPCFDEPSFKANFSITLGRPREMVSLSNMPKMKTTPIPTVPGYEWDYFERSVPMSSYVVALIVADYSYVETSANDNNITFRVWARHSAINQTKLYALELGPKMLMFFQEFFGIDYPLPKQDMIALPSFPGAMENWGLITYGEQQLLYDPDMPSDSHREMVAQVVAHEQAHQWFGNLVTMEWWNELWLNEGFASYMSYIGANHFEPNYRLCQQFVINEVQSVMGVDGLTTSHPINQPVHHPDEINQIFDRISYNKGASIVRMLAEFLGHGTFQRGLSYYLKSRMYGNAVQDDLWEALTYQAKKDLVELPTNIKTIMDSWTEKMGFPVVNVNRNYISSIITASQERFLLDSRASNSTFRWWIPLTYSSQNNPDVVHCEWIEHQDEAKFSLEANESQWVIFNVDQVGYYRVNYDQRNWDLLARQLLDDPREISVINRAQLIDDSFNLARAGLLDYSITFNVTSYLQREVEYIPWRSAATGLKFLDSMLCRTPIYGAFQDYVIKMVDGLFLHVGESRDDDQETIRDDPLRVYTRTIAWRLACHFQHCGCLRSATKLYSNWMDHPDQNIVPTPLKSIVACTAVAHGGKKEWEFAYFKFNISNIATEKDDLLEAMSCSNEPWIIKRMLEWTLNGPLAKTDAINLIVHLVRNPLGRYLTFDFFQAHWDQMMKIYRSGISSFATLLDIATETFNTQAELNQIHLFGKLRESGLALRTYDQLVERVEANIMWMARYNTSIILWLSQQKEKTKVPNLTFPSKSNPVEKP